jgi:hypothetical protein
MQYIGSFFEADYALVRFPISNFLFSFTASREYLKNVRMNMTMKPSQTYVDFQKLYLDGRGPRLWPLCHNGA